MGRRFHDSRSFHDSRLVRIAINHLGLCLTHFRFGLIDCRGKLRRGKADGADTKEAARDQVDSAFCQLHEV